MNEKTRQFITGDKECLWHPFTQMKGWLAGEPVVIESGEGFYLIDTEGRRYIDGVSSLWCNVHGHRVSEIDCAIREQLDRIAHSTLLGLAQTRSVELAERLIEIAPKGLSKVFYSDSGATAVEIALKMAYQFWRNQGRKTRTQFIALQNSYHGDTIGSVSVGGMELFHGIFHSLLFETYFVSSPHPYRFDGSVEQCLRFSLDQIEQLLRERRHEIAAVVLEPLVQGAAGMIVHPPGFLKAVREVTKKFDTLLIVDEVATGFGRTGRMFACEHENVTPDLMCLAKGITGGYLPLAATLATQQVYEAFLGDVADNKTFYHGHTYTGNALGCAAAMASLDLFEQNRLLETLPDKIAMIHDALEAIARLDHIGDVRQCGMMVGIEIVRDKTSKESFPCEMTLGAKLCAAMRRRGAMMRPLSDVIVLMPPLAIDRMTLQILLDIVTNTLIDDLPRMVRDA
ncbi:MAG: adenosylmethionine--8-amino-7-oxononanoate transaminase [Sedimentisphaerales bacterium]|nr:adenosylmethionine--8-amino-7-oxononanoate transaminase [Sedimentisphaerales bacterium]